MKKNTLVYAVWREEGSRQFHHIHVEVYRLADLDSSWGLRPLVGFTWQGDPDNTHWYAFRAEAAVESPHAGAERFREAAGVLAALSKAEVNTEDPAALIIALGLERRIRDDREDGAGEWVRPAEAKPASWSRYMAWLDGSCVVACVAPDEAAAGIALLGKLADHASSGASYAAKLERWLQAGRPVRQDDRSAPDVRGLAELLKPMKEPAPEALAAAA